KLVAFVGANKARGEGQRGLLSCETAMLTDARSRVVDHPHIKHECDSSTSIYTHVSDDFMNTALRRALGPALENEGSGLP
ncbi:MAG: hypothetical protein ACRD0Z_02250, partial [Acidimicrobiales bacterium]